jgi:hypothetical protein
MSGKNFKNFAQWMRNNNLTLKRCNCGMYDGEHDVDCAQVLSEEALFEQWRTEVEQKENVA